MIFGKIDYLNLLPFQVFMKKELKHSAYRSAFFNKKGVPSKINLNFKKRKIDAAFISSIHTPKLHQPKLGICVKKEVQSVLVVPGKNFIKDPASETSNALAEILNIYGEVVIGDRGLILFHNSTNYIDLAKIWNQQTNLPFVFATLSFNKKERIFRSLTNKFLKQKIKIPYYIIKKYSQKLSLPKQAIDDYLNIIYYKIGKKEEKALKKFLYMVKNVQRV